MEKADSGLMNEQQRQEPVLAVSEADKIIVIVDSGIEVVAYSTIKSVESSRWITHSDTQLPTHQRGWIHLDTNILSSDCAAIRKGELLELIVLLDRRAVKIDSRLGWDGGIGCRHCFGWNYKLSILVNGKFQWWLR